ncbi:ATP-grasp domain-containing protein [Phytomonospora sp. NPDC050363]|uniref:ATP-grasp domain-containing protein n=1 Tax=Phytomonospora sp. NPDC050363 TaxID=3155642 RepID=UPI0033ED81CE
MKTPILVINRHSHGFLFEFGRCLLPLEDIEPHLVTHAYSGVDGLDSSAFRHTHTCSFLDPSQVEALCAWIIDRYSVRHVVALHERAMTSAARLRTRFGLPGLSEDGVVLFRDKIAMKRAAAEAGILVPDHHRLDSIEDLRAVPLDGRAWVMKPRYGVGSKHVSVVTSLAEASERWSTVDPGPGQFEIEEFVEGDLFHCDAVVEGGSLGFAEVSRYLANPGEFGPDGMAGSVNLPPGPFTRRVIALTAAVVAAFGFASGVLHLEVFRTDGDELVLLEVAARPGGGGIDRYLSLAHGVNIIEAAVRVELGLDVTRRPGASDGRSVWGVVGFYPGEHAFGVPSALFGELGIVEHLHDADAGRGSGAPRHCTDYRDRYIVRAADLVDFEHKALTIGECYRSAP